MKCQKCGSELSESFGTSGLFCPVCNPSGYVTERAPYTPSPSSVPVWPGEEEIKEAWEKSFKDNTAVNSTSWGAWQAAIQWFKSKQSSKDEFDIYWEMKNKIKELQQLATVQNENIDSYIEEIKSLKSRVPAQGGDVGELAKELLDKLWDTPGWCDEAQFLHDALNVRYNEQNAHIISAISNNQPDHTPSASGHIQGEEKLEWYDIHLNAQEAEIDCYKDVVGKQSAEIDALKLELERLKSLPPPVEGKEDEEIPSILERIPNKIKYSSNPADIFRWYEEEIMRLELALKSTPAGETFSRDAVTESECKRTCQPTLDFLNEKCQMLFERLEGLHKFEQEAYDLRLKELNKNKNK